jgi:hypothetical protein
MTASKIDGAQAGMGEADQAMAVGPDVVRDAVANVGNHPPKQILAGQSSTHIEAARYAAHYARFQEMAFGGSSFDVNEAADVIPLARHSGHGPPEIEGGPASIV